MNEDNIKKLKKHILYLCSHTGTKETDLLYYKLIVNKIDTLTHGDLQQLLTIFKKLSDTDIFLTLTNKIKPNYKYKDLFDRLKNEK